MSRIISQQEITLRFTKMVVAHYITSAHGYTQLQDLGVEMLAKFIINHITKLLVKVKKYVELGKRTIFTNSMLLEFAHQEQEINLSQFHHFIIGRAQHLHIDQKLIFLQNLGNKILITHRQKQERIEKCNLSIKNSPLPAEIDLSKKPKDQLFHIIRKIDQISLMDQSQSQLQTESSLNKQWNRAQGSNLKDRAIQKYVSANKMNVNFFRRFRAQRKMKIQSYDLINQK